MGRYDIIRGGLSRFDGTEFVSFTTENGPPDSTLFCLVEDRAGNLWFGTRDAGASRYNGKEFLSYTIKDGLANDDVRSIIEDRQGHLWFGTQGGVSRYDGRVFQTLSSTDGLGGNIVQDMHEDRNGDIWIATLDGGVTRYLPPRVPPGIDIIDLFTTDQMSERHYRNVDELRLSSWAEEAIVVEFQGRSFTTSPTAMVYLYRLQGHDEAWRTTKSTRAEYENLPSGEYLFEVKAVDRDLNYSEPTQVLLRIHPPYGTIALIAGLGVALIGLVIASSYGITRRRERDQTRQALGQEQRQRLVIQQQMATSAPAGQAAWRLRDFVEQSPAMQQLFVRIESLYRPPHSQVLFTGEPGTGKELLARALHNDSTRGQAAFVPVRCASIPQEMQSLEIRTRVLSQLFGHAKGAFEGADDEHDGAVIQADGGTLFLDEIGLMPLPLQTQLEHVLRQGEVRRLGEDRSRSVNVRTVASTQMDLEAQVKLGLFRQELYDFISKDLLEIPPLRERPEDIALLAQHFVDESRSDGNETPVTLSSEVLMRLQSYSYPGNVRELKQMIERAMQESGGHPLEVRHFHFLPGVD